MLAHYRITAALGAGGMGEVYRATDTRLGREVSLKLLPSAFASDPERLARFDREARLLASLNHPNIAQLYGFETVTLDDGAVVHVIAMELAEGEELAERLKRGPIPLDDAIAIAKQIAEALEEAHGKSIVHRDLKPANIKLTPDGRVKVLDFGLAKAYSADPTNSGSPELSQSPTMTRQGTEVGVILGTAAYMSPEQARGKAVDQRTDIWAFGVVLFEMLTGKRLFAGDTISDTLAAVLRQDIDWKALPGATPPALREALRRCLEREPGKRLHHVADARLYIDDALEPDHDAAPRWKGGPSWPAMAGAAVAAVIGGALAAWHLKPSPAPSLPHRTFAVELASPGSVVSAILDTPAISQDGRILAFTQSSAAGRTLWIRDFGTLAPREIPGTAGARGPFFSPDATEVAYFTTGSPATLRSVPVTGGPSRLVCELPGRDPRGGAWLANGRIVFGASGDDGERSGTLHVVPARGGVATVYAAPDPARSERGLTYPSVLADGASLIVAASVGDHGGALLLMNEGERRILFEDANERLAFPAHSPPGYLVYQRGFSQSKGVWALPFDGRLLRVTGDPLLLDAEAASPTVARDGTLVHGSARLADVPGQLVWVDRRGDVRAIDRVREGLGTPALAPDGRSVAFDAVEQGNRDVWVLNLERDSVTRLTFDPARDRFPVWTPDGALLAFQSFRTGAGDIYVIPADGSADAKLLVGSPRNDTPNVWTPDGQGLLYTHFADVTGQDLMLVPTGGEPRALLQTARNEGWAHLSPDARFAVYDSNESGQFEIYVAPFPAGGRRWQISSAGGSWPRWSPKGQEIFFIGGPSASGFGPIMAVPVDTKVGFQAGPARALFEAPDGVSFAWFSVAADASRFLSVRRVSDGRPELAITFVQNWADGIAPAEGVRP